MRNVCVGELIVKLRSQDVMPYAKALAERLVPILMAPAGALPRSILENRCAYFSYIHSIAYLSAQVCQIMARDSAAFGLPLTVPTDADCQCNNYLLPETLKLLLSTEDVSIHFIVHMDDLLHAWRALDNPWCWYGCHMRLQQGSGIDQDCSRLWCRECRFESGMTLGLHTLLYS